MTLKNILITTYFIIFLLDYSIEHHFKDLIENEHTQLPAIFVIIINYYLEWKLVILYKYFNNHSIDLMFLLFITLVTISWFFIGKFLMGIKFRQWEEFEVEVPSGMS